MEISRRRFLQAATLAASTGAIAEANASAPRAVRHAVIGTGGQGRTHVESFNKVGGCELVAICDVDPARLDRAAFAEADNFFRDGPRGASRFDMT